MFKLGVLRAMASAAVAALAIAGASAQTGADADYSGQIETARDMIFEGDPMAGLEMLRPIADALPDNIDAHFFRGVGALNAASLPEDVVGRALTEAERTALLDEAIASLRHVLEIRPDIGGARLELGRALFDRGKCLLPPEDLLEHIMGDDCDEAAHHYRRALADGLPEMLATATHQRLNIIRARKRVTASVNFSVAPDTNINTATTETRFIPAVPIAPYFEIDESDRAQSGVGFNLSLAGDYRHPVDLQLFDDSLTQIRIGSTIARREYKGSRFDSTSLSLRAGPEVLFRRASAWLLLTGSYDWRSGSRYGYGLGLRFGGSVRLTDRLFLSGGLEGVKRKFRNAPSSDGPRYDVNLDLSYTLTPAVVIGARAGFHRTRTDSLTGRYDTKKAGVFTNVDLPPLFGVAGFRLGAAYDKSFTDFERPGYFLLSPNARRDRFDAAELSLTNVNFKLFEFSPRLLLMYETNKSNIQTFGYDRARVEIGMGRVF